MKKEYVEVYVLYTIEGRCIPRHLIFRGQRYEIDKILDVRPGVSIKVGGVGMRYTIVIDGTTTFLYEEDGKWFVEAKN